MPRCKPIESVILSMPIVPWPSKQALQRQHTILARGKRAIKKLLGGRPGKNSRKLRWDSHVSCFSNDRRANPKKNRQLFTEPIGGLCPPLSKKRHSKVPPELPGQTDWDADRLICERFFLLVLGSLL